MRRLLILFPVAALAACAAPLTTVQDVREMQTLCERMPNWTGGVEACVTQMVEAIRQGREEAIRADSRRQQQQDVRLRDAIQSYNRVVAETPVWVHSRR